MTQKELADRFLDFGAGAIRLGSELTKTFIGRHIANQMMRSATSAGANWQETCGAESRSDFVHKMQIVLKELRESSYWLQLLQRANVHPNAIDQINALQKESEELTRIIAKSVVTAKAKKI